MCAAQLSRRIWNKGQKSSQSQFGHVTIGGNRDRHHIDCNLVRRNVSMNERKETKFADYSSTPRNQMGGDTSMSSLSRTIGEYWTCRQLNGQSLRMCINECSIQTLIWFYGQSRTWAWTSAHSPPAPSCDSHELNKTQKIGEREREREDSERKTDDDYNANEAEKWFLSFGRWNWVWCR